mmetsp:Transcript_25573/g.33451  ORF Transcript_25573/g.33451 Transcript_25573/m.33451 type:complete len:359 (+) Transcript_25573:57-1133(+)
MVIQCSNIIWGSNGQEKLNVQFNISYCECDEGYYSKNELDTPSCINLVGRNLICSLSLFLVIILLIRIILFYRTNHRARNSSRSKVSFKKRWNDPLSHLLCYSILSLIFWFQVALHRGQLLRWLPFLALSFICYNNSNIMLQRRALKALPLNIMPQSALLTKMARAVKQLVCSMHFSFLCSALFLVQVPFFFALQNLICFRIFLYCATIISWLLISCTVFCAVALSEQIRGNQRYHLPGSIGYAAIAKVLKKLKFSIIPAAILSTSFLVTSNVTVMEQNPLIFVYLPLGIVLNLRCHFILKVLFKKKQDTHSFSVKTQVICALSRRLWGAAPISHNIPVVQLPGRSSISHDGQQIHPE